MVDDEKETTEAVPQTVEFDLSDIKPSQHSFIQRGSMLVCTTPGHEHAHPVGPNKLLQRTTEGGYTLKDI